MSGTSCCGAMAGSCFCDHGPASRVEVTVVKVPSLTFHFMRVAPLVREGILTSAECRGLAMLRYRQALAGYRREEAEKRIGWYGSIEDRYA